MATVSGPASHDAIRVTAAGFMPVGTCVGDLPTDIAVTLHR
jgi:hypothetical protein